MDCVPLILIALNSSLGKLLSYSLRLLRCSFICLVFNLFLVYMLVKSRLVSLKKNNVAENISNFADNQTDQDKDVK